MLYKAVDEGEADDWSSLNHFRCLVINLFIGTTVGGRCVANHCLGNRCVKRRGWRYPFTSFTVFE